MGTPVGSRAVSRKSTATLALKGAFKVSPARALKREGEKNVTGPLSLRPPSWMDPYEKKVYKEIASQCHPDTVTSADQGMVEALALLVAEMRQTKPRKAFPSTKMGKIMNAYAALGMTPVDRSRVSVAARKDEDNEFAEFAAAA